MNVIGTSRAIVFNLLFLLYIIQLVIPIPYIDVLLSLLSFLAFLLSLGGIQFFYKVIISVSIIFSITVMFLNDLFTIEAITYFSGTTNILVLLAYASFFAIPVILGVYPQRIYRFFKNKIKSFSSTYTTFTIITFILCSVMNASAIPTIQTALAKFLKDLPPTIINKFQSITFVRPFIMTLMWSPVAAAPTIAISGTGAHASIVLPITFSLAVLFLLVDMSTSKLRFKNEISDLHFDRRSVSNSRKTTKSLVYLLLHMITFIAIILGLSSYFHYSIIDAVVMMIIPYSLFWSLLLKRGKRYFSLLKQRMETTVPKVYAQVALFVPISVMIHVIEKSTISDSINQVIAIMSGAIGPFILIIISTILFMITWTGIIPQLVVVLATQTLSAQYMGVNPEWLALAILGGALTGSASSPFTMNANIVAVTINDTPLNVVKHNIYFAFSILLVTSTLAIVLQMVFG